MDRAFRRACQAATATMSQASDAPMKAAGMLLFAVRGMVMWHIALPMAVGQLVGGWLGAHLTVRGGERVVRWVLLCVVAALVLKLSFDALRT